MVLKKKKIVTYAVLMFQLLKRCVQDARYWFPSHTPKKSSKPEVRTSNLPELILNAFLHSMLVWFGLVWFLFVFFCFGGFVLFCVFVFLGKKNRKLILLSTNKIWKQNVHKHKCQEKILIILWLRKKSWEGLPHSKYWVLPEDLESCERKG